MDTKKMNLFIARRFSILASERRLWTLWKNVDCGSYSSSFSPSCSETRCVEDDPRGFGLRREAKRHAALAQAKAPSPPAPCRRSPKRRRARPQPLFQISHHMRFAKLILSAFALSGRLTAFSQPTAEALRPELLLHAHGNFSNNIARPLRYWPVGGDFVITNGTEYFNRPLYCLNSGFRIDGGDKPEFSLYLPGRGGNLRFGIRTAAASKWLNDAGQIVTRYRAGSLIYEIHDPLLHDAALELAALPLDGEKGLIVSIAVSQGRELAVSEPVEIIIAFGGANGLRGARGGDIGCERQPVSEFFQLRPEGCRDNAFSITNSSFTLRHNGIAIAGLMPPDTRLSVADATKWNSPAELLASAGSGPELPVLVGEIVVPPGGKVGFWLQQLSDGNAGPPQIHNHSDWSKLFDAAEKHRRSVAKEIVVETPDPFINAAVPALCVAADAVWDEQQQCFMHGAVAWRTRLLGWRGPYAGDALGWHDRTAAHFAGFARQQNTSPIPPAIPAPDEQFNLARSEAAIHSNGDLSKNHYDMNLVAVDAFFRHLLWTGDTNYAREMWPVIERHFAWERRLFRREFGPHLLPLYEGYAAIWASDDLNYNGAGTAHASAYNYFANTMAARVAKILGQDPAPYQTEADLILRGMNQYLWLTNEGSFAESKDWLGLQSVHPNSGLWTFYHTMDSEVASPAQSWLMTRWIDGHIARIPISGDNVPRENLFTLPETSWLPYQWSLNNVVMAEAAHTALGYWQANRSETAFALFKGELLDSMFLGLCPGNLGCMTSHDMARGEAQRDFADAIGVNSRALIEGLFGIHPDALAGQLKIVPGFPANWPAASLRHPDLAFEFRREPGARQIAEEYRVVQKFPKPMQLTLQIVARGTPADVTINDQPASWNWVTNLFGVQRIEITCPPESELTVWVQWKGTSPPARTASEPVQIQVVKAKPFNWSQKLPRRARFEAISLTPFFNDEVTQIFLNDYRSPRSPFASLATPKHGIGGWCEPNASFGVDDSGLRAVAGEHSGRIILPNGISFATPADSGAKNIIFTSQWNNYPREVSVPLDGKSSHAFLLMAGSTGPMQSRFDNGEIVVTYADGSTARLALRNPANWWPIDQDYFTDDFAFRLEGPLPPRVDLATGKIRLLDDEAFKGHGGRIPGGAATVLDLPLDQHKRLRSLTVRALANEVVIGLMAVTLER
jgi:hypothetical protein